MADLVAVAMQAKDVAAKLKPFNLKRVYVSPFYRWVQALPLHEDVIICQPYMLVA